MTGANNKMKANSADKYIEAASLRVGLPSQAGGHTGTCVSATHYINSTQLNNKLTKKRNFSLLNTEFIGSSAHKFSILLQFDG